jgi:hypothetical protein
MRREQELVTTAIALWEFLCDPRRSMQGLGNVGCIVYQERVKDCPRVYAVRIHIDSLKHVGGRSGQ